MSTPDPSAPEDEGPDDRAADSGAPASDAPPDGGAPGAGPEDGEPDGGAGGGAARPAPEGRIDQTVFQTFLGSVHTHGGTVGISGDGARTQSRRASGKVSPADIDSAVHRYAPPAPHAHALSELRGNHVVALYGAAGLGKRTSAINLLHTVAGGPLVTLSPADPLGWLAERDYTEGAGYLACGLVSSGEQTELADFTLGEIARRVQEAGAYLVLTVVTPLTDTRSGAIPHIGWSQPAHRDVLLAHGVDPARVTAATQEITSAHDLGDVVRFAVQLAGGTSLEEARGGLDLTGRVVAWFEDGRRTDDEILEVTALLFMVGMPERRFEAHLARLRERTAPVAEEPEAPAVRAGVLAARRPRRDGDSLIKIEYLVTEMDVDIPGPPRRCLVFREYGHRRHVAAELCAQFDDRFWAPVFAWLLETVQASGPETRLQIAAGLALLCGHDSFDAVREVFLQPWSAGEYGPRSWDTAIYVLWCMCVEDTTAPLALRTAIRWSRSGIALRRLAAAEAFCGELGVRYPAEALSQLWHLMENGPPYEGREAVARLYATLVSGAARDARVVLDDLEMRLRQHPRPGSPQLLRTLNVALAVLSIRDGTTGHPAAARHLLMPGTLLGPFAKIWSTAIVNRPARAAAFEALYDVLHAMSVLSPSPEERLRPLAEALAASLPDHEHGPFRSEFERYVNRRRDPQSSGRLLLSILLSIFTPNSRPHPVESR
ncbi:hypothetical protein [Streptosporangium roseum]|uniref:Uncharacterized protein n=1 Tax=Streptosporangium roseum (strain ATCC 12428 / DSM 43021 / JCM 3005 / KCTC 9067 / NCIMB 10171 / NRRL 2505 / NI 9100) TaxID=479432 RepID=D2ARR9_STRRD|nr:hypothetical protein [Streptosporangium roseum]ACZ84598.1 hypothetical protein Sros_1606 [Streptosporangium roseum DSM 43021]